MRIAEIRVHVAAKDLQGKVWNPKIRWLVKHSVLLEVISDEGGVGLGECWCFDREPDALLAFLASEVIPRVLGEEVGDSAAIGHRLADTTTLSARHGIMASAASGLDIALWDLAARSRGLPLWRFLGGERPEVPVYASGGLYGENKSVNDLAEELAGYVTRGFNCVKMKVGALPPEEDEARVRRVRERLGDQVGLMIDGVYSFDRGGAESFFSRVADCRIEAFQSPLPAADVGGMSALVAAGVPVMALEAEYRPEAVAALLQAEAVAILQFALVACGGIGPGRRFVEMATVAGRPCSLEVSSTGLAALAALHFAAAHRQVRSVELHQVHDVFFDRIPCLANGLEKGILQLPELPGLGFALPREGVERRI